MPETSAQPDRRRTEAEGDLASLDGSTVPAADALGSRPLRAALGAFATGVAVVTARDADGTMAGLTVNSFSSVSLDPPLVLFSQSLRSPSLPLFRRASHFIINILAADQQSLSRRFARPSADKFAGVAYAASTCGAPILHGAVAHFQCRREHEYDGGDHAIFIGRVERYASYDRPPLIFLRGDYVGAATAR